MAQSSFVVYRKYVSMSWNALHIHQQPDKSSHSPLLDWNHQASRGGWAIAFLGGPVHPTYVCQAPGAALHDA